jgi:hypothetical protein
MGTSVRPNLHGQLDRVTRHLAAEFTGLFSQETIGRYVEESAQLLSRGATV